MLTQSCLLLLLAAPAPPLPTLQWKFREGDFFSIRTETTSKQSVSVMGNDINQTQEQVVVSRFTVKKVNRDGSVVLEQKFVQATNTIQMGGGAGRQVPTPIAGATLTFTLNARREVIDLEGHQALLNRLTGNERTLVEAVFSETALKHSLSELFSVYPPNAVSTGAAWNRTSRQPLGPIGSFELKNVYKYGGKERVLGKELDKVTWTADFRFVAPAPVAPGQQQGQPLPYRIIQCDLKGEDSQGTLHFDAGKGRLFELKSAYRMKGKMTIEIGGMNTEISMDHHTTTKSVLEP